MDLVIPKCLGLEITVYDTIIQNNIFSWSVSVLNYRKCSCSVFTGKVLMMGPGAAEVASVGGGQGLPGRE